MKYTPELINGIFTVNDSGKKVKFTKGNLYWNGKEFLCEANQYDYPTIRESGHIGHFFWSKTVSVAYAASYSDSGTSTSDKFFAADGGVFEGFTVLSKDEWDYLLSNAVAKNSSSKNTITIDDENCIVLKPNGFSGTVADTYTAEQWVTAEASGLVALPFAGYRNESDICGAGDYSYCWSSTPSSGNSGNAYCASCGYDRAGTGSDGRDYGYCVRLVSVQ